jgi:hypothetical protein
MDAHRSTTAKVLAAIGAVGLIPFGLAVVGSLPTEPSPTVQAAGLGTPAYAPNWIAIRTGTGAGITLNGPGSQGATETLGAGPNCGLSRNTGADLVTLSGSTGGSFSESLASYASGSIGVKEKKSGTSCYQVNAVTDEALRIGLGPDVSTILGDDAVATSAYLDVELKGGVRILATATLDDEPVGRFELQSGSESNTTPTAGAVPFDCNLSPDSGADSNVSDNCRWPISAPSWTGDDGVVFDTLTLDVLAGSFSLEGGSDGTVQVPAPNSTPNASIIEIAADTIDCGGQTAPEPGVGDAPSVTVYRLANADADEPCQLVPYALESAPLSAQFLKPLDSQTSAQFIWDVTWRLAPTAGGTLPALTIDYEFPAEEAGQDLVTLGWCPDAMYVGGVFVGYPQGLPPSALDQEPDLALTQFACVISRSAQSVDAEADYVSLNDDVYVYGDARLRV